jgi:hypothetical protein
VEHRRERPEEGGHHDNERQGHYRQSRRVVFAAAHLIVLAGCWSWAFARLAPDSIKHYFFAKLASAASCWAVYARYGRSIQYTAIFVLMGAWCLAVMLILAREYLPKGKRWAWAIGLGCALLLAGKVLLSGEHYTPIELGEGAVTMFAAIPACVAAASLDGPAARVTRVLALLWLLESLFEFGFSLHLPKGQWLDLNERLPTVLACIGAIVLAREATATHPIVTVRRVS